MTDLQIAVFSHTQYRNHKTVHGPADTLLDYLNGNIAEKLIYLQHPLHKGDKTSLKVFASGRLQSVKSTSFYKIFPDPLRYAADLFTTLRWLIPEKSSRIIIAIDPLNFFYAYCLKKINKADKLIYYTVDYAYRRFENPLLNKIYHWMDSFAVKRADVLWNSCKKIQEVRRQQGVSEEKNLYLPNTPVLKDRSVDNITDRDQFSLVNIFSNHSQIDFDIMFNALSRLIEYFPKVTLKLIGRGDFAKEVIVKIKDKRLLDHIKFMDISSHDEALREVARSAIGLECNNQTDPWNAFREPIKIMEYITFGLPVISKPGHGMVDEITKEKIGFIVNDAEGLIHAVRSLLSDSALYGEIQENIRNLAKKNQKEEIILQTIRRCCPLS